jgi:hypothetical protein
VAYCCCADDEVDLAAIPDYALNGDRVEDGRRMDYNLNIGKLGFKICFDLLEGSDGSADDNDTLDASLSKGFAHSSADTTSCTHLSAYSS